MTPQTIRPRAIWLSKLEKKQPLPLWRRIALALVIAAMAGVLGLMLTAYIAEIQFCGEIRKISKAGEPTKFPDLLAGRTGTQTGEDANWYYVDALRQFRPADATNLMQVNLFYRTNMASLPAGQFPGDLREKVADTLNKAKPIFENLDKGAQLTLPEFDIGITLGSQVCKARLDSAQCAVFLSSLRTLDLILAGKGDAAADSIISTLQLTRVFDTYPTMLVQGRKMICVGLACGDIQLLLGQCSPSENRLNRLQSLLEETFSSDSFKEVASGGKGIPTGNCTQPHPQKYRVKIPYGRRACPARTACGASIHMASYAYIFRVCEIPARYGLAHKGFQSALAKPA